jgi:hypothetical protein
MRNFSIINESIVVIITGKTTSEELLVPIIPMLKNKKSFNQV